jgi:RNA polymerase sigma-70 factor, ECF subfamily
MIVATKHWGGVAPSADMALDEEAGSPVPGAEAAASIPASPDAPRASRGGSLIQVDEALVLRGQAGDVEALCELASKVRPLVQRYASRFFSDPTRAEDLAQTAMMKAFSRVGDVRSPEAFPAWLLRITRNECLNELARQRHAQIPMSALDDQGMALEALADATADPEEALVRSQLQELVRRVAAGLPPHYRRTLTMRALEDRTYEEISEALDIPVTVARLWYCRARKRFRRAFVESMVARRDVDGACLEMGVAIAEMIEGTLGRTERDRVQGHLSDCAVCRQTEDELRNTAFRAPSRAFVLGLGLIRGLHHTGRTAGTALSRLPATASRLAVTGAGGLSLVAAGTLGGGTATVPAVAAAPAAAPLRVAPAAAVLSPGLMDADAVDAAAAPAAVALQPSPAVTAAAPLGLAGPVLALRPPASAPAVLTTLEGLTGALGGELRLVRLRLELPVRDVLVLASQVATAATQPATAAPAAAQQAPSSAPASQSQAQGVNSAPASSPSGVDRR